MCKEWNTFVEEKAAPAKAGAIKIKKEAKAVVLSSVKADEDERERADTGGTKGGRDEKTDEGKDEGRKKGCPF